MGKDSLKGGEGNDWITGGAGKDILYGGVDDDVMYGEEGRDKIIGDEGYDVMFGGADADRFRFYSIAESDVTLRHPNVIIDFTKGLNRIDITGLGLKDLDTDGGLTETRELRLCEAFPLGLHQTIIHNDQNGFTLILNESVDTFGAFVTDADFIF